MNIFDMGLPNVLECRYFTSRNISLEQSKRTVANYELDFNLSHGRIMWVNGKKHIVEKNSIVFRKPGDIAQSEGLYDMYLLTFAFDKEIENYNRNTSPQIPVTPTDISLLNQFPLYIKPHHTGEIVKIYRNILSNFGRDGNEYTCAQLVTKLLYLLAAEGINVEMSEFSYSDKINAAIAYISEHYAEQITLEMIADYVHFEKSYLTRCFKKAIGKTPIDYLIEKRIETAKTLLTDTTLNISEIAMLCGFSNASYFTVSFHSVVGVTPTTYRKKH